MSTGRIGLGVAGVGSVVLLWQRFLVPEESISPPIFSLALGMVGLGWYLINRSRKQ